LKDGDKNDEKKDSKQKKNNKDTTRQSRRRMKLGRSFHPRLERLNGIGARNGIGASIIKHGAFTHHRIARLARSSWPRPTGKLPTRLKSKTNQAAQAGQTICMPLSWPIWPARTWNDGSDRHGS
jgi:hypothetical protein